jgi:hypothetical protein
MWRGYLRFEYIERRSGSHRGELISSAPQFFTLTMGRFSLLVPVLLAANGAVGAKWIGEVKKVDGVDYQCKCYSDNACWPTNQDWEKLNQTVNGALQVAVPPGAVCHKTFGNSTSVYDAAKCADTQANWANEQWL